MKYAIAQITGMCIATYLAIIGLILLVNGNAKMNAIVPDFYYEDELAYRQYMQAQSMQHWGVALLLIGGLIATAAIAAAWSERIGWKRQQRAQLVEPVHPADVEPW